MKDRKLETDQRLTFVLEMSWEDDPTELAYSHAL